MGHSIDELWIVFHGVNPSLNFPYHAKKPLTVGQIIKNGHRHYRITRIVMHRKGDPIHTADAEFVTAPRPWWRR